MPITQIEPFEAKDMCDAGGAVIIDVRSPDQYQKEHIVGASNAPAAGVDAQHLPDTDGRKLIVHCNRGGGATRLCNALMTEDDSLEIYHLKGGIEAWKAAGFAVE